MKKVLVSLIALLAVFALVSCATAAPAAPFEVGEDYTEYAMDGASSWAACYEAYVKVAAGDDVLFNGTVKLTSDGMYVGEFLHAAGLEKGFSTDGDLSGFVYTMGQYVGGTNDCYWTFTVNGKTVNWGCNEVHVLEGDYIEWSFAPMAW